MNLKSRLIYLPVDHSEIQGDLNIPEKTKAIVVFVHGSGGSRHSLRNTHVADVLNKAGFATLLVDLLTPDEEVVDFQTAQYRFDIDLLADRLKMVTQWLRGQSETKRLHIGYFGASTGAAAALVAAAKQPDIIEAVVSRSGRPDLAGPWLLQVHAPVLLIAGGEDRVVIELNYLAINELRTDHRLEIIPGAGHLFEEPGALDKVAILARDWFREHLILADRRVA